MDESSSQFGPCLWSVGVVCADTLGIIPFLGLLNFLDWWQWCDDSADDAGDGKSIFC